ncbi:MAG: hypothetical protein H7Y38_04305 [Armatimonadetes bacterium]|nr:hypothetical protein [Armatimonadota bacterium]
MNRSFCAVAALLTAFAVCSPSAWAQKVPAKPAVKLPSAASILDASTKASGGTAALSKMKTIVMIGTLAIPAQKITGQVETRISFPDKIYSSQEISGFGKFEKGYDGKTGWSRDPLKGLQAVTGAELTQLKSQGDDMQNPNWRKAYSKAEMVGLRKVGAANTYAIRLTPKRGGKPIVTYYDTKTKLPIRTDIVIETAEGSTPTQSFTSDFRTVSGIVFPFKMRQVVGGVSEVNVVFTTIQVNAAIPGSVFAKPAETAPKPAKP